MHIALPLYIYPSKGAWQPLFDAVNNNPAIDFRVIVNPNNGPGGSIPDSCYITNVSQLNKYSNIQVFGYVHVSYASRALSEVKADIDVWQSWSQHKHSDIHMAGIFIDEAPASTDHLPYMTEVYKHVKATLTNGNMVWTNPGVAVDPAFYRAADSINAYENCFDHWANKGGNLSVPEGVRDKSTVMVHSCPHDADDMREEVRNLVKDGYHGALIVLDSNYTSFSTSWSTFTAEIDRMNKRS